MLESQTVKPTITNLNLILLDLLKSQQFTDWKKFQNYNHGGMMVFMLIELNMLIYYDREQWQIDQ